MKTADKIRIDYIAAKQVGREHAALLVLTEKEDEIEVRKIDATGHYSSEWTIWVDKTAARQVARVYVPRTGYEAAISSGDAGQVIVIDSDPEATVEQTKYLNAHDRKMKQYR
jgi:hypothetical protein